MLNSGGWIQWLFLQTGWFSPKPTSNEVSLPNAEYNLQLLDMGGNRLNFKDLQGKTIFLNIWATWCPPCIAEMPGIEALYQKTQKESIAFVLVSVDEDPEIVRRFMKRKKYEVPIYFLQSKLPTLYQHSSIPRTYVIDSKGKLAYKHHGIAQYDSQHFRDFLEKL